VIEAMEEKYRDFKPIHDYGGFTADQLWDAKLRFLRSGELPKLKGWALFSER
jgi:hypothetical protein